MDRGYRDYGFVGTCAMVLASGVPEAGLALKVQRATILGQWSLCRVISDLITVVIIFPSSPSVCPILYWNGWGRKKGLDEESFFASGDTEATNLCCSEIQFPDTFLVLLPRWNDN